MILTISVVYLIITSYIFCKINDFKLKDKILKETPFTIYALAFPLLTTENSIFFVDDKKEVPSLIFCVGDLSLVTSRLLQIVRVDTVISITNIIRRRYGDV